MKISPPFLCTAEVIFFQLCIWVLDWRGHLISQEDGSFLETSIPLHLDFIKARKRAAPKHFAQVVRLAKYWTRLMKQERPNFRFKSFMIELILAKLLDNGVDFSNYPEALQAFFTYLVSTELGERIVFEDNYPASKIGKLSDLVQIIDPVNPINNVLVYIRSLMWTPSLTPQWMPVTLLMLHSMHQPSN